MQAMRKIDLNLLDRTTWSRNRELLRGTDPSLADSSIDAANQACALSRSGRLDRDRTSARGRHRFGTQRALLQAEREPGRRPRTIAKASGRGSQGSASVPNPATT